MNGTEHLLTHKAIGILMKMPEYEKKYRIVEGNFTYDAFGRIVEIPEKTEGNSPAISNFPLKNPKKQENLTRDEK